MIPAGFLDASFTLKSGRSTKQKNDQTFAMELDCMRARSGALSHKLA